MKAYWAGVGEVEKQASEEENKEVDPVPQRVQRRAPAQVVPSSEIPAYFHSFQTTLFRWFDAQDELLQKMGTRVQYMDDRVDSIEQHLTCISSFTPSSSSSKSRDSNDTNVSRGPYLPF